MKLHTLLEALQPLINEALADLSITGLTLDSRHVQHGEMFIALNGSQQHGLTHAGQAIANGAIVILFDPAGDGANLAAHIHAVPTIAINNLNERLGELAARFYGQPSQQLSVIGITGTNGKTSCSQFLAQTLDACGIIGTLGWGEWGQLQSTVNTTPDALAIQQMLAALQAAGKRAVAMEVSSHGLAQGRVHGVHFKGAVFTNLSRDHLDYHHTMADYLAAKRTLFQYPKLDFVVVNLDAADSEQIIAVAPPSAILWGISRTGQKLAKGETLNAQHSQPQTNGLTFTLDWRSQTYAVTVPLYGDFNVENVLLVLAVLLAMGMDLSIALARIQQLQPISGRMEAFGGNQQPLVFVDYAHTPDALEKVLSSARQHCQQKLWVVFGCGGNRDVGKRPLMGEVAARLADHIIITDDNPRFEANNDIIQAILSGCRGDNVTVLADREQAIQAAIQAAAPDDCIVIAGKGHENYQEIQGVRYHFSDQQLVINALATRDQNPCK